MSAAQAKAAHKKFKQTGELPPHLKKLVKDLDKVKVKYKVKNIVVPGLEWMADIKDEGFASDAQRRAAFASGYKAKGKKKKKEGVNEGRYHDWRNDESLTPRQKIGRSIREVKNSLKQLSKMIDFNVRLKNELKV